MVGAGFSRTCRREHDAPAPPLWGDFAARMEGSLGYAEGKGPNALRLAQEYQAQHGEDGLDRLIRELVTDDRWEPSNLHLQLMEFPWVDVLTTNWDTLLERTSPKTPDRVYSCVQTISDLARSRAPRIVKLHGSLPSSKPFIFTEDEFRTYPARFAPFVNLAQQVMLENELCLIGFSGIDPNFLAWSGWVRDTLHVSARRIRLVGVLNLTPAARSLLEHRNVTPIDLAPLVETDLPDEQHEKALELFFSALIEAKPPSPFEWALSPDRFNASRSASDDDKASRKDVAATWAADRRIYPGWVVAPERVTRPLRYSFPTLRRIEETPADHLRFAAEHIWRRTIAGIELFPRDLEEADRHFNAVSCLSTQQRTDLCVSAVKHWRKFRDWDRWSTWMRRLAATSGEDANLWHAYETGWKAVLDWDDDGVQKATLAISSDAPIWVMRRAALCSTLFSYRDAALDYKAALLSVRQKLRSAPRSAWLISIEGWAALFHKVTFNALTDDLLSFAEHETDETRLRYAGAKVDPWDEISRRDRLATERSERNRTDGEGWALSFKPGRYRPSGVRRIRGDDECPFYGLLDLMERTGAPERSIHANLFSDRLVAGYLALKGPDDDDLMTLLARYRGTDVKILDRILPRMRIARLSDVAIKVLLDNIGNRIDRTLKSHGACRHDDHVRFLLGLLARVVVRAESPKALEIYQWCLDLLNNSELWWTCLRECGGVLATAIEAMDAGNRQTALQLALEFKLPSEGKATGVEDDWPELIDDFTFNDLCSLTVSQTLWNRVEVLIASAKTAQKLDRTRALMRLARLHRAGKLTKDQNSALEDAIWSRRTEAGWPEDHSLYLWVFLELPGRDRAEALFAPSFLEPLMQGQIGEDLLRNLRFGLSKLDRKPGVDTLTSCVAACVNWRPRSREASERSSKLFGDVDPDVGVAKEIGYVLASALLPACAIPAQDGDLASLISSITSHGHISTLSATAYQIFRLCPNMSDEAIALVRSSIASRDPTRVYASFVAIGQFLDAADNKDSIPAEIVEILLQIAEQRLQPGLANALECLATVVDHATKLEKVTQRLAKALPPIIEEYRYDQDRLDVPSMAELPLVRRQVRRLAQLLANEHAELHTILTQLNTDPMPEVCNV
ncbi:MAG: SIR2 family protein [Fuscovulum sp.]|nr:MAG: SIR2 family protein [Fuscovulum sp.]